MTADIRVDISDRSTLADRATHKLRDMILSGALRDGAPLRQDALAEALGVSRIPVREALARLERDGLVASFPHRGYIVTGLSRNEVEELFGLRILLEPDLLSIAIPKMSDKDIAAAAAIFDGYVQAIERADNASWGHQNTNFHMALYAPAGRPRSLEIVRGLLINTDRYTRLVLSLEEGVEHAKVEHAELLDLCRRRAVNQAVALTRDHIERARHDLIGMMEDHIRD